MVLRGGRGRCVGEREHIGGGQRHGSGGGGGGGGGVGVIPPFRQDKDSDGGADQSQLSEGCFPLLVLPDTACWDSGNLLAQPDRREGEERRGQKKGGEKALYYGMDRQSESERSKSSMESVSGFVGVLFLDTKGRQTQLNDPADLKGKLRESGC